MPETDSVAAYLAEVRERTEEITVTCEPECGGVPCTGHDALRLRGAVDVLLTAHKIEPLYAHADSGECGCPVPGDEAADADDIAYEAAHPEGHGPDGTGLVCSAKVVGYWCTGCADVAVEHGCFEAPKDYPPEKCSVREAITGELLTKKGSGNDT